MEDTGRSSIVSVRITDLEKRALQLRAKEEKTSESSLAHRMMQRGSLDQLVAFYFGDGSSVDTNEYEMENDAASDE